MKKLIITEEEKKKILNQHINSGYKTTINEQSSQIRNILRGSSRKSVKQLMGLPEFKKYGTYKNLLNNLEKLSDNEISTILAYSFKNSKGNRLKQLGEIISKKDSFIGYLRTTEGETIQTLRKQGFPDSHIQSLINGFKKNYGDDWAKAIQNRKKGISQIVKPAKKTIKGITNTNDISRIVKQNDKNFKQLPQNTQNNIVLAISNGIKTKKPLKQLLDELKNRFKYIIPTAILVSLYDGKDVNDVSINSTDQNVSKPQSSSSNKLPDNWYDGIMNKKWTLMKGSENQDEQKYPNLKDAIKIFQNVLGIEAIGIFGPKTDKAVRKFQQENNLTVDGIIGNKTLQKMIENGLITK